MIGFWDEDKFAAAVLCDVTSRRLCYRMKISGDLPSFKYEAPQTKDRKRGAKDRSKMNA